MEEPRNALWRRAEQLNRWHVSDTNKASSEPRHIEKIRVKFQDSYVFLAACSSGDTAEVERLIAKGANINTANIDGLTALHQACIDDNLDMVKFLVERGADINACDNEGWTALHATSSCGFLEVAKYLIEKGADIALVNSDGELAIDLGADDDMDNLVTESMENQGIDAESARNEEERVMLEDATELLNNNNYKEQVDSKTGATALHVAAAKGYIKVMQVLLKSGANIDAKDIDGWSPLHAAAHWGQEEACKVLVEGFCNMEMKSLQGQTVFDVADPDIEDMLEELKRKQTMLRLDKENRINDISPRGSIGQIRRSSVTRMSGDQKQNLVLRSLEEEREMLSRSSVTEEDQLKGSESSEADSEEMSTESSSDSETEKKNEANQQTKLVNGAPAAEKTLPPAASTATGPTTFTKSLEESSRTKTSLSESATQAGPSISAISKLEKPGSVPPVSSRQVPSSVGVTTPQVPIAASTPRIQDMAKGVSTEDKENGEFKNISERTGYDRDRVLQSKLPDRSQQSQLLKDKDVKENKLKDLEDRDNVFIKAKEEGEVPGFMPPSPTSSRMMEQRRSDDLGPASWRAGLRKTGSSSAVSEITANAANIKDAAKDKLPRSASSSWLPNDDLLKRRNFASASCGDSHEAHGRPNSEQESKELEPKDSKYMRNSVLGLVTTTTTTTTGPTTATTTTAPSSVTTVTATRRRSFEPPKRDEEKEVERKARAKRARETRRSTQGVTKEDLERAEESLQAANQAKESREPAGITTGTPHRNLLGDKSNKENKPEDLGSVSGLLSTRRITNDSKTNDDSSYSSYRRLNQRNRDSALTSDTINSRPFSSGTNTTNSITAGTTSTSTNRRSALSSSTPSSSLTVPYRSSYLNQGSDEKDASDSIKDDAKTEDKSKEATEDPSQKSSAIRSRKKRESRRPTGKVTIEDIQEAKKDGEKDKETSQEIKESRKSDTSKYLGTKYGDTSTSLDTSSRLSTRSDRPNSYAGTGYSRSRSSTSLLDKDVDYKRLYEEQKEENERLKKSVKKLQQDLSDTKLDLEKARLKSESSKSGDSAAERRERRMLERKVSELEEELKQMESLDADNKRLKEENGALIRVISKLSK